MPGLGTGEISGLRVEMATPQGPSEKPPLLVHGMWDGAWIWENYLRFFLAHPEEQARVYGSQIPESGRQTFDIAVAGFPVDASKVRCPVLMIGAGEDRITPGKVARNIARRYGADFRLYEGFARMITLESGWERGYRRGRLA